MKQFLSFITSFLLFTCGSVIAQPVLTTSNFNFIGISFTQHSGSYYDPGLAGENQIWDFSSISATNSAAMEGVSPADTPFAQDYPDASFAGVTTSNSTTSYSYYSHDESGLYLLGVEIPGSLSQVYSDSRKDLTNGLTYLDTYTDSEAYTTDVFNGYPGTSEGQYEVEADGYGTLILPDMTYENVLRLHIIETAESSFDFGTGTPIVFTSELESYAWFIEGLPIPLLLVTELSQDGVLQSSFSSFVSGISTSVFEANTLQSIKVYPNPAVNSVTVDLGSNSTEGLSIEVFDVKGALLIKHDEGLSNSSVNQIDISKLESGIYFLHIRSAAGYAIKKLVK